MLPEKLDSWNHGQWTIDTDNGSKLVLPENSIREIIAGKLDNGIPVCEWWWVGVLSQYKKTKNFMNTLIVAILNWIDIRGMLLRYPNYYDSHPLD